MLLLHLTSSWIWSLSRQAAGESQSWPTPRPVSETWEDSIERPEAPEPCCKTSYTASQLGPARTSQCWKTGNISPSLHHCWLFYLVCQNESLFSSEENVTKFFPSGLNARAVTGACGCVEILIQSQTNKEIKLTPWAGMFWTLLALISYIAMEPFLVPTAIRLVARQWEI